MKSNVPEQLNFPVNGAWSLWTTWTCCSLSSSNDTKTRTRSCTDPEPLYGGSQCEGDGTEMTSCNANDMPSEYGFVNQSENSEILNLWRLMSLCGFSCSIVQRRLLYGSYENGGVLSGALQKNLHFVSMEKFFLG